MLPTLVIILIAVILIFVFLKITMKLVKVFVVLAFIFLIIFASIYFINFRGKSFEEVTYPKINNFLEKRDSEILTGFAHLVFTDLDKHKLPNKKP
jgi:uncharacterized SAM-binding protein YcdF (DUF218 family)